MKSFPTVKALAKATEDAVLSHWSGLGYYARARNLHKTAQMITIQYAGRFPQTVDALSQLPGIGQSTAGAIISFSTQKKAIILDGNVKRVLARYFAIEEPINQSATIKALWKLAETLTPEKNSHQYNQAMMDLGATLCTRTKPKCHICPFSSTCLANKKQQPAFYPIKIEKKTRPVKSVRMLIIQNKHKEILLLKRPSKGIWGGLWSFPESEKEYDVFHHESISLKLRYTDELPMMTHQFTHFTLHILPILLSVKNNVAILDSTQLIWYKLSTVLPGGIAAPVAKILQHLSEQT